jgi:hypothetical protein
MLGEGGAASAALGHDDAAPDADRPHVLGDEVERFPGALGPDRTGRADVEPPVVPASRGFDEGLRAERFISPSQLGSY